MRLARGESPVQPDDLRYQLRPSPRGFLYVAVLDTSASMLHHRIEKAKGLLLALLHRASGERSSVAVVTCGGQSAQVAAWPTRSTPRLMQAVAERPAGGGTPLADGLAQAASIISRWQSTGGDNALVILISDGGANVGQGALPAQAALARRAERLRELGVPILFVDTKGPFAAGGRGRALAGHIGASYVDLGELAPQ